MVLFLDLGVITWLCLLFDHLPNATLRIYIPFHMSVCLLCTTKSIFKIHVQVGSLKHLEKQKINGGRVLNTQVYYKQNAIQPL